MKKLFTCFSVVALCLALTACSSESQSNSSDNLGTNESQASEIGHSESVVSSEVISSEIAVSEVASSEEQGLSDYQSVLDEYTAKLQEATPTLIEEYQKEAAQNTEGLMGLAELSNTKISKLAEISMEGTQKMAEIMLYAGSGSMEEYQEWAGKLQDVYLAESQKITDAYMESAK